MIRRLVPVAVIALASSCSQRAPWRVVETSPSSLPDGSRAPLSQPAARVAGAQEAPASGGGPAVSPARSGAAPVAAAPMDATTVAHLKGLRLPVGDVDSMRLDDSFDAPRDGGIRKHNAIDIMAPRGTPVLAVADGRILRLMKSSRGGLTLYAADLEDRFVYYYAHLDRYNPRIYAGKPLMRGDTLGYVGTTGNAPRDLPHLHFQVMRMPADGQYMRGEPINPYPLLRQASSADQ
jgi:murein DD-endopeptidase MepM/ murein hydrolase activator NlpD